MKNINVYILGNLNDTMTGDELERTLDAYREAENQLACFGFGVLSPHHLPADLRGKKGDVPRAAMIRAADICYKIDFPTTTSRSCDLEIAELLCKEVYLPDALYQPDGYLRGLLGVEKIEAADKPEA